MLEVFTKVLPIFLYCTVGVVGRKTAILSQETINQIKKLVLNIIFPCLLFPLFLLMELNINHMGLVLLMMLILALDCVAGYFVNRLPFLRIKTLPLYCSAFSYASLGIPLYALMHGTENLPIFAVMGVGHELFVWLIYYSLVRFTLAKEKLNAKMVLSKLFTPVIVAILSGLLLNILGIGRWMQSQMLMQSLVDGVALVGALFAPLTLLCVGYNMRVNKKYVTKGMKLVVVRLLVTFSVAYALKPLYDMLVVPSSLTNAAFFTWAVLPPVYSYTLMMGEDVPEKDKAVVDTASILQTIINMGIFIGYHVIHAA